MARHLFVAMATAALIANASASAIGICLDTCMSSNNGVCEDGGASAANSWCSFGTDCTDCGPRGEPALPPCHLLWSFCLHVAGWLTAVAIAYPPPMSFAVRHQCTPVKAMAWLPRRLSPGRGRQARNQRLSHIPPLDMSSDSSSPFLHPQPTRTRPTT